MKVVNYTARYIVILLLITAIGSCKKSFLELTPKGKLIAKSILDYERLLNNAPITADYASGANMDAQAALGDEIAAVEPYFQGVDYGFISYDPVRMQRLFKWEDVVYEPEKNAHEMGVMNIIYLCNKVINEVPAVTDGTDERKKVLIAQARASRAWVYLLMINYYGKPYNEATSSTDPGFPIITVADVTETKFVRASVKEVYDFIIEDLTTSIPDLPKLTHRRVMSKSAAEGLLGKVYLFMGKFENALSMLSASIESSTTAEIPVSLYDYNSTFGPGGAFLPIGMFGPLYPAGQNDAEVLYLKQFTNYWTFTNSEFALNPQTVSLFNSADLRLNFYSSVPYATNDVYPNGMMRRIGPISTQFGLKLSDVYLMKAECQARLNELGAAVTEIEAFREKRMPASEAVVPGDIAGDRIKLVKFILEERIREFAVQGYRWFDMRRLSVDPDYNSTINSTHTLYKEDGSTQTFMLKPERLVLQFPRKLMDQNPGMENNP
jgi:tetratricopeptide (TPR) repeat protein